MSEDYTEPAYCECCYCPYTCFGMEKMFNHVFHMHPECELCGCRYTGTVEEHMHTAHVPKPIGSAEEFDLAKGVWLAPPNNVVASELRQQIAETVAEGSAYGYEVEVIDHLDDPVPRLYIRVPPPGDCPSD